MQQEGFGAKTVIFAVFFGFFRGFLCKNAAF